MHEIPDLQPTPPEHMSSSSTDFCGVRVAQSIVFCIVVFFFGTTVCHFILFPFYLPTLLLQIKGLLAFIFYGYNTILMFDNNFITDNSRPWIVPVT